MKQGTLQLDTHERRLAPGSRVGGVARWTSDEALKQARVLALWTTSGKGTRDEGAGAQHDFGPPRRTDEQRFELRLPEGPLSFEGHLITLEWKLELVLDDEIVAELDFVLSPFDQPIVLTPVPKDVQTRHSTIWFGKK